MSEAVRISPTSRTQAQAPTAARTYRPDLNPVSTPTSKPSADPRKTPDQAGVQADLRGSVAESPEADLQSTANSPFGDPDVSIPEPGIADASAPNTSGTRNAEVPAAVKRWNWAAFLMPAVWGLFSGVPYTALLFGAILLPTSLQLIVMGGASLYLGLKGNELAWRGKKWRSVEHFNAFQKQWTSWAVKLTIAVGAILIILAMIGGSGGSEISGLVL
jgi:hypothetical protein